VADTVDALILDLLEWIGPRRRLYSEVIDAWRTSCPRLPVWEEANERGFLDHHHGAGRGAYVSVSERGREFLETRRSLQRARHGSMAITHEAAELWLTKYGQAWETRAPQLAADLFTEDCRYFETPFSEPAIGRDGVLRYWQAVPEGQSDITFRYRILAVQAPTVIAHWSASFTRTASDTRVELDGVFVLEFTAEGRCRTLREWWHREEAPPSPGEN
jgi:hypothetical protein